MQMHHPLHHHLDHPSHLINFLGYLLYAILVLGISLVIAALAYGDHAGKDHSATPALIASPSQADTEPLFH